MSEPDHIHNCAPEGSICVVCGAEMVGLLTVEEHAARCPRYSYGMRCTLAAGHNGDHRTHDGCTFEEARRG